MHPQLEKTFGFIAAYARLLGLSLSPVTCARTMQVLKRFYRHLLMAGKDYRSITKDDIELYMSLNDWTHATKAMFVHALKRFYSYLLDKHLVGSNPAANINVPFLPRHSLTPVPLISKVRHVLRKLERDKTPAGIINRLLVELAYGSGLRRMELVTLNVEDVNLTDNTLHVLGKGRKQRVVPLSRRCLTIMKDYLRNMPATQKPLFVLSNGQRIKPGQVGVAIKKSTGLHPHYFRHACATHMLIAGCNIRYIQELLGHERLTTTQIYTKLDKEELRKVINKKHPGRLKRV